MYGETVIMHRWASFSRKKWKKTKWGLKNCINYKLQQLKMKVTCWNRMTNRCMITDMWHHFPPCKNIMSTNSHAEFFVYISMRQIMPVGDYVTILSSTRPTLFFIKRLPSVFFFFSEECASFVYKIVLVSNKNRALCNLMKHWGAH